GATTHVSHAQHEWRSPKRRGQLTTKLLALQTGPQVIASLCITYSSEILAQTDDGSFAAFFIRIAKHQLNKFRNCLIIIKRTRKLMISF
ncbi:hypothetical protein, partial [Pseudoalteromonas sp.]|uniref:hypothetical protein n=1 Tax=Pseudoalteromonas sp. TaxID=53249 RepID=UPI0026064352